MIVRKTHLLKLRKKLGPLEYTHPQNAEKWALAIEHVETQYMYVYC